MIFSFDKFILSSAQIQKYFKLIKLILSTIIIKRKKPFLQKLKSGKFIFMPHIFRLFIQQTLINPLKSNPHPPDQITIHKLLHRLKTLILKTSPTNQLTLTKFQNQIKKDHQTPNKTTQPLVKNELYLDSLKEVTEFIFKLAYGHPGLIFYPKYNIENVIGFYEICKYLFHSDSIFNSIELKKTFNSQVITLLFTQKIIVYKDIYYRIEQSSIFKNFIDQLFTLIQQRIKLFLKLYGLNDNEELIHVCESHIRCFVEVYQLTDSMKKNSKYGSQQLLVSNHQKHMQALNESKALMSSSQIESEEYLNAISIDEIIICFVFLVYRMSHEYTSISLVKMLKVYFDKVLKWEKYKKFERVMEIYNNCYLKLFLANRLQKFNKHKVIFNQSLAEEFQAQLVENGGTILDNFVSSFEN